MEIVCEKLEQNLILVGATAIEDKLQHNVPETIEYLLSVGFSRSQWVELMTLMQQRWESKCGWSQETSKKQPLISVTLLDCWNLETILADRFTLQR